MAAFWATIKGITFYVKNAVPSFWATYGNFVQLFFQTSGHTGW